jgi:hypothetical protein
LVIDAAIPEGIPKQFQNDVIAAVTTGSFNSQAAKAAGANAAVAAIVHKVVAAAYGAFAHSLDLSLMAAGALMLFSALVALSTMPPSAVGGRSAGAIRRRRLRERPA